MSIEVSVIMISYNNYPLNLFSLYALENQTFDRSKMEIILVDDASTDETSSLAAFHPPFNFKYIRCKQNEGRAKGKNRGVKASQGNILVFIDSEMILDPDYVQQHYCRHKSEDKIVITGCSQHYNTFTALNKKFSQKQIKKFYHITKEKKSAPFPKRWKRFKKKINNLFEKHENVNLFTRECIKRLKYKKYAYPAPFYPEIIKHFGTSYHGFEMPWIFVITHNISIKRSLFDTAGPFYEKFDGYGCEDWEFGYRLYKHGAKIFDNPGVKVYHQEHPRNLKNQYKDSLINYRIFFQKHHDFETGVQALCWIGKNFFDLNNLILEYRSLVHEHPDQFEYLINGFKHFFETILTLLINDQPAANLWDHSGLDENSKNRLITEMKLLKSIEAAPQLYSTMKQLLNK